MVCQSSCGTPHSWQNLVDMPGVIWTAEGVSAMILARSSELATWTDDEIIESCTIDNQAA